MREKIFIGGMMKMAVSYLKVTELKKELRNLKQDELIALMVKLYKNKEVKSYLNAVFKGDAYVEKVLKETEDKIYKLFNPKGDTRSDLFQLTKKLVTDFCKITDNKRYIIDIKLRYAYYLAECINGCGGGPDSAYDDLCNMYADVVKILNSLKDKDLYDEYATDLKSIRDISIDLEFGVGEEIDELYSNLKWTNEV